MRTADALISVSLYASKDLLSMNLTVNDIATILHSDFDGVGRIVCMHTAKWGRVTLCMHFA